MRARHIVGVLAILFFAFPIGARLAGVTAPNFENQQFAERPRLSQGWDLFPQTTRFFTDRMPLRKEAIAANRRISATLFDTQPTYALERGAGPLAGASATPKPAEGQRPEYALEGRGGWMYYGKELDALCKSNWPVSVAAATKTWIELKRTLERRGTRTRIVTVPGKATIYPEYLPDRYASKDCFPRDIESFWQQVEAIREPGFVPMRGVTLAAKQREHDPVFLQKDSHWNEVAASNMVRAVLRDLGGPAQMRPRELSRGTKRAEGDLTRIVNDPQSETAPTVIIRRAPDAPMIGGRTVIMADSFALNYRDMFARYFERIEPVWWYYSTVEMKAAALANADTAILENIERYYVIQDAEMQRLTELLKAMPPRTGRRGAG